MERFGKLTPAIALTAALILVLTSILVATYNERGYQAQKTRDVAAQARILASSVTAALTFNDPDTAQEYVNALRANPEIAAAAVYDQTGRLVASYHAAGDGMLPLYPIPGTADVEHGRVTVVVGVTQNNDKLGAVYLATAPEPMERQLARFSGVGALLLMGVLIVAVLSGAQTALARVNRELEIRAQDLVDVNTRLQAQIAEREKVEDALRQAQKMETIGQLTGGVAHDFNNLLTIILGNLRRLQQRLIDEGNVERMRQAVANAIGGAERAAALTRSLLAFSRRQPLNPKPVDVNNLIAGMSDLLRRSLGEGVRVETVVAGGLWRTSVDPNQLENALLNLAVNARDAMPDGGKLTIETANAHLDSRYAADHDEVLAGQYVAICVTDTGVGMSRSIIDQVFEPFFTTKEIGKGTGLGLSQVYGFVKQSGGHVKIYSERGEGTTVKIYLPRLLGEEQPAEMPVKPMEAAANGQSETILVVEDDPGVREHTVETLRELGFRVIDAADGAAALGILDRLPGIDLMFTDVGLPGGMNGRQLADEAQRRHPALKVVFTTAYARNAIIHEGRLDPGVHLVTKPFTVADVASALRVALAEGGETLCILLVEDELLVRMDAAESLAELGFEVVEAASAGEAMGKVRELGGRLNAAIVDLGLPDRRGDSLAAELRALHAGLPIVIASGYVTAQERERFASDRLIGFVDKPYQIAQLRAVLATAGLRVKG